MKIFFDSTQLKISEAQNPDESAIFTKITPHNSGIIGAWSSSSGSSKQLFIFKANHTYTLVGAIGHDQVEAGDTSCSGAGIEYGNYQIRDSKLFVDCSDH